MRLSRSLRLCGTAATLWIGTACGGGAAATPTVAPTTAAAPAAVPSAPARPALASPLPSPTSSSAASSSSSVPAATPSVGTSDSGGGETYTVQSGDTLLSISEQFYGDATQWRKIYDANKDVIGSDPDKLKLEMKLKIPPKS